MPKVSGFLSLIYAEHIAAIDNNVLYGYICTFRTIRRRFHTSNLVINKALGLFVNGVTSNSVYTEPN